jgi:hypothetical protein
LLLAQATTGGLMLPFETLQIGMRLDLKMRYLG